MEKVYTKQVRERTNEILGILKEVGFFEDIEQESTAFAEKYLNEVLTEKFIAGEVLELGDDAEVDGHLDRIIQGSLAYELKDLGYLNSYEDETTPEVFFLTDKGKEMQEKLKGDFPNLNKI